MQHAIRFWILAVSALVLGTTSASASTVVVPPLVPRSTPAQTANNMTTLIASELEFTGEFETVIQLPTRPQQLGTNCLGSTPCLNGIAKSNGSSSLLAGKVTKYGTEFEVVLTYLSAGKIVRTVKRRMDSDPANVADELSFLVRHAITGVDPEAKAQADKVSGFEGGALALMDEEDEDDDDELLMAAPMVGSLAAGSALGSTNNDLDDLDEDPYEGRQQGRNAGGAGAGAAAGGAIAASSRGASRASAPSRAPARAPAAPPADTFDPNAISFGGSADEISFGSAASLIEVNEPDEDPFEYEEGAARYSDDLDDQVKPQRSSRTPTRAKNQPRDRGASSRTPTRSRSPQGSNAGGVELVARMGFARFQFMNFVTYGIEASFQVQEVLAVVAGFDGFSTRRLIPPELVPIGQPAVQWNTLVPINAGLLYRPSGQDIRPYVGAGTTIIPGYVKEAGAVAFGFHARGGVDFLVTDNFGINLNANAGMWAGTEWYKIEGLMNTGFATQIGAGTLLVF
jgi:hypothetical protein